MGPHERWTALLDLLGRDGSADLVDVLVTDSAADPVLVDRIREAGIGVVQG